MTDQIDPHSKEVSQGDRFEFGKNWARFLTTLTDERIAIAERSLSDLLRLPRLDGMTFLDIGSGSGLFSLVARRLGATVTSFDYDPHSVACTTELRRRYFPEDPSWRVMRGSVLDRTFMDQLGTFDIVYSWGVLHHTGAMAEAFANVKPRVPVGGRLFIAIYNDLGAKTDWWWRVKRRYNALPPSLRLLFALGIIGAAEARTLASHVRQRDLRGYVRTWTDYKNSSARGMSRWHDWIDWIGGYPYERADIDSIVDEFGRDGFALFNLVDRSSGTGCNEFVFNREAPAGTCIDQQVSGSRLCARRFGAHLVIASTSPDGSVTARPSIRRNAATVAGEWLLLQDDRLLGALPASDANGLIRIPAAIVTARGFDITRATAVPGRIVPLPEAPVHQRDLMWSVMAPDLKAIADDVLAGAGQGNSPVYVWEDEHQLKFPHSVHADIARYGGGRFSHWGAAFYFSSSDGSDPTRNGRRYCLVIPAPVATCERANSDRENGLSSDRTALGPKPVVWTPELVGSFWDAFSYTKLENLSFGKLAGPYLLHAFRRYLGQPKRILDFGSGDGHFLTNLISAGLQAAAFEPSPARRETLGASFEGVSGFLGFAGAGYVGPRFDVICMFEVIEHILDDSLPAAFALIDELLSPDGLLLITTPNNEDLELGSCIDPRGEVFFHRWQHVRNITIDSLTEILGRFGFAPIVINQVEFSDVVFGPSGAGLASRADYANLFNTYRPLTIGNGERLMAVTARTGIAQKHRDAVASQDEWSRRPVVVRSQTVIVPADSPTLLPAPEAEADSAVRSGEAWALLEIANVREAEGHCWTMNIRLAIPGEPGDVTENSDIELFEGHLPLGPRHSALAQIQQLGQGRFLSQDGTLYFSTSDNTDPRVTGRAYRIKYLPRKSL